MRMPQKSHGFQIRSQLWSIASEGAREMMVVPPLQHHTMDRSAPETAWKLLEQCGYASPEEAWEDWPERPNRSALSIRNVQGPAYPPDEDNPELWLRRALVLGKCRRDLFDPDAPSIWTMDRLTRGTTLVLLEPEILD
jgi:hypothetical protein